MSLLCRTWGHRFEPRYSEERRDTTDSNGASSSHRRKIYEGEVCRCGATIDGRAPMDETGFDTATGSIPRVERLRA